MITPENSAQYITNRYWRPKIFFGLSTDTKPTENIVKPSAAYGGTSLVFYILLFYIDIEDM